MPAARAVSVTPFVGVMFVIGVSPGIADATAVCVSATTAPAIIARHIRVPACLLPCMESPIRRVETDYPVAAIRTERPRAAATTRGCTRGDYGFSLNDQARTGADA